MVRKTRLIYYIEICKKLIHRINSRFHSILALERYRVLRVETWVIGNINLEIKSSGLRIQICYRKKLGVDQGVGQESLWDRRLCLQGLSTTIDSKGMSRVDTLIMSRPTV